MAQKSYLFNVYSAAGVKREKGKMKKRREREKGKMRKRRERERENEKEKRERKGK